MKSEATYFDLVGTDVFSLHLSECLHHTTDVCVLDKGVGWSCPLPLYVHVLGKHSHHNVILFHSSSSCSTSLSSNNAPLPPSPSIFAYMPTLKSHFHEPDLPKSGTLHNFQEHSKCFPCIYDQVPDFMGKSQGSPTLCTSLANFVQMRMLFTTHTGLSTSPIISQQHCKLQSPWECHISHLVTKGHFSWYSFLGVWKHLSFAGDGLKDAQSEDSAMLSLSHKIFFAKGALILKLYSACSFADVMFSSANFGATSPALSFAHAQTTSVNKSACFCLSHMYNMPGRSLLSSSTKTEKTLSTLRNNRKCGVCHPPPPPNKIWTFEKLCIYLEHPFDFHEQKYGTAVMVGM